MSVGSKSGLFKVCGRFGRFVEATWLVAVG
jgi:hypothetical protein